MTHPDEAEVFWEKLYRKHCGDRSAWGARPNPRLAEVVEHLALGIALDLGCGTGGDTIWLARHGWQVVAVDISSTAVEQVGIRAQDLGLGHLVTTEQRNLARTFPGGTFDLVSAQYFHTPFTIDRGRVLRSAAHALRPDGRLLVVDHGSIAPWSWNQDPQAHFPTPTEIYEELGLDSSRWAVERADAPRREATGPAGQTATVVDHILLVRRESR